MKTRVFFFLAAAVLLASCAKEIQAPVEMQTGEPFVLQVGINNPEAELESEPAQAPTRTYLGDAEEIAGINHYHVYWSNGDRINVNGKTSDALADIAASTAKTSFAFTENGAPAGTSYKILYPAGIYDDDTHVNLPAVQTYKAGGFADGMFPMAGYSSDGSAITLNHLCAVVKVSILRETSEHATARSGSVDTDNVTVVRFRGKNDEQVSGNIAISYTPSVALAEETGSTSLEKDVCINQSLATSTADAIAYYLVVPARTYSNGFDIIVQDANKHAMTKSKASSVTLVAGKMYSLTAFEFVPTGSSSGIEIASAEDLIAFAQAYNDNAYVDLGTQLVATITNDLVFDATSSAAFDAINGIGTDDNGRGSTNHFNGIFNGNDHTISGLDVNVPLFSSIGTNGTVKNLILDNSCSFTFTHANTAEGMFGSIAGYHKGKLDKVKSAASVSLAAVADVTNMTTLGGLVGYANGGKIQNASEFSGLITTPSGFTSTGKLIIGGLAGRIKTANSTISGSYFKGAINNAAQITSTDKSSPYLIIGGVVGFVDGEATVSSTNTTADHEDEASAYNKFNGKIVNKTTVAYHSAVGGIVGELNNGTVSSCTNAATIALSVYKVGGDGSRYMKTGGIVGKNNSNGTISNCTNNGTVQHRSNPRLQDLGGIAGYNAGSISGCTNNAAVNQMTSGQSVKAGRIVNLGGIIGENVSGATVSDVHNTANIQISSMEDGSSSEVRMGGVIAWNGAAIDGGATKNITNAGQVYLSPTFTNQFLGYEMGGVVGYSEASISNVKNTGCVYVAWNHETNVASKFNMGGIVGRLDGDSPLTLSGCENNHEADNEGKVHFLTGVNNNNYVGGILGFSDTNVTVSNCENNGLVTYQLNVLLTAADVNTPVSINGFLGGIMGGIAGGKTASISLCTNNGEVFFDVNGKTGTQDAVEGCYKDAFIGGIMAKGSGISFSGCSNTGYVHGGNGIKHNYTSWFMGGIVAHLSGTSSIQNCSNTGTIMNDQVNNDDSTTGTSTYTGGLAGWVEGTDLSSIIIGGTPGCTIDASVSGVRGWVGGVVGAAKYVTINSCTVEQNISCATRQAGGVVGLAENTSISSSSFKGSTIHGNNIQSTKSGGIAAQLTDCTVDGCSSYVTTLTKKSANVSGGAIVGNSVSGNTIQNCHYKATINSASANIAGSGTFSGSGNVADL